MLLWNTKYQNTWRDCRRRKLIELGGAVWLSAFSRICRWFLGHQIDSQQGTVLGLPAQHAKASCVNKGLYVRSARTSTPRLAQRVFVYPLKRKMRLEDVGRLVSFWDAIFSGAILSFGGEGVTSFFVEGNRWKIHYQCVGWMAEAVHLISLKHFK